MDFATNLFTFEKFPPPPPLLHPSIPSNVDRKEKVALQRTTTHCTALQGTATQCYILQHTEILGFMLIILSSVVSLGTSCNVTLQSVAACCSVCQSPQAKSWDLLDRDHDSGHDWYPGHIRGHATTHCVSSYVPWVPHKVGQEPRLKQNIQRVAVPCDRFPQKEHPRERFRSSMERALSPAHCPV